MQHPPSLICNAPATGIELRVMSLTSLPSTGSATVGSVVLRNASWGLYEMMLQEADGQNLRLTYDTGRLSIMSPLAIHERWKRIIGRFIEDMSLERNVPIASLGSTTWKRKDLLKGLEGDECYYIQHEPLVRGKLQIDPDRDPPPDLAVEIDVTHNPIDRDGIYAALGVTEIWHYDGESLRAVGLIEGGAGRRYEPLIRSRAFPFLDPRELEPFIAMLSQKDETSIVRAWREHLRTR